MTRFHACLALVLEEETSYRQPLGGPYVRLHVTDAVNRRRAKRGEQALPLGRYTFDEATASLRHERGSIHPLPTRPDGCAFDDDPHDTGGRTSMGILQREYDAWRGVRGLARQDVWRIGDREIEQIFEAQYWLPMRCTDLPPGIDYFMADFGFLAGIGKAAEKLQRVLGAKVDRHVGVATVALVARADQAALLELLQAERVAYLKACRTFWKHGPGWLARADRVMKRAAAMVDMKAVPAPTQIGDIAGVEDREPGTASPSPAASRESPTEPAMSKTSLANVAAQATSAAVIAAQVNAMSKETQASGFWDLMAALANRPLLLGSIAVSVLLAVMFREEIRRRVLGA